ncbi:MAG: uracil-DNA glycosylase [Saprospiraceae bacterium]|nr:uracil-DNA glycosylase [Saprospiraceae bacterium]
MDPRLVQIHPEWQTALAEEFKSSWFDALTAGLKAKKLENIEIYPPGNLIFNAYNLLAPAEVKVVIVGQDPYHNPGEAMGLSFSVPKGTKTPPSLKNVYKELQADLNLPIPPHGDLTAWAKQEYLSTYHAGIVFMLWGNYAKSKAALIDSNNHCILESAHPSPLAGNAFQGCRHFSKANEYLTKMGKDPVNWIIPL